MNEADLLELLMDWFTQISSDADRYFTLVSAYLVVAYLAGGKLSTLQLAIINSLFLLWVSAIVLGTLSALEATTVIEGKLQVLKSDFDAGGGAAVLYNFIAIQIGGIAASLFFMWSVRHPRTERTLPEETQT